MDIYPSLFRFPMSFSILLILLIFILAFLYASVGHGGASGYLAAMALLGVSPLIMKPSALFLNLAVSLISFFFYTKKGYFRLKLFWPFAIGSIPMAYLGAQWSISDNLFKKILAISLIISILRLLINFPESKENRQIPILLGLFIGGLIGLISGLIGIGGGILLSPILLLFHWAKMKETAAISALFIFVNSLSGLAGIGDFNQIVFSKLIYWAIAAIIGAWLGGRWGAYFAMSKKIKQVLALVLFLASIKLFLT